MTWNSMKNSKPLQGQQEPSYTIKVRDQEVQLPASAIVKMIKEKLIRSPSVRSLLEEFEVSPEKINDLVIEIMPLDKKYAETDLESMRLNTILFDTGDFFQDYYFVVPHELVHWLSRIKEEQSYFNDPEELLGFVMSVAAELERKTPVDVIWNRIYPKVSFHFHDENDAKQCFENMLGRAKQILDKGRDIYAASVLINSKYPDNIKTAMSKAYKDKSYKLVQKIASDFDVVSREEISSKITTFANPYHIPFCDKSSVDDESDVDIAKKFSEISKNVGEMVGPEGKVDDPNSPLFFKIEGVDGIFDSAATAVKVYKNTGSNPKHTFKSVPKL